MIIETTDAAASTATAYSLAVGDTAQGRVSSGGDSDWYRINLVSGVTYTFAMAGEGATSNNLLDTYLNLRNSAGTLLASDDDSGPGSYSSITFTASSTGTYYLDAHAYSSGATGQYGLSAIPGSRANYDLGMGAGAILTPDESWAASPGTGATVTYGFRQSAPPYAISGEPNTQSTFSQLTAAQIAAVHTVMHLWGDVSGLQFTEVNTGGYTNNATILFGNYNDPNDGAGAFSFYPTYGQTGAAQSSGDVYLNTGSVSTTSLPQGAYSFFAIMHEVGHAVGFSHPGDYNAAPGVNITYASFAQFIQDTQQYSVMSYFDEASAGTAQFNSYADTPMLYDVYALQLLYGANMATRIGDTVYGFGSNAGSTYDFASNNNPAVCIWDAGGVDTLNCSGYSQPQDIDLNAGVYSNIGGLTGNVVIAYGAVIENATGGSGADTITGNAANNVLTGNGGSDTIYGGDGNDIIIALTSDGNDTYSGGNGFDILDFSAVQGVVQINQLDGTITGSAGNDILLDVIEQIEGSNFDDVLSGGHGINVLDGNGGNDQFFGNNGEDLMRGGAGDDTFYFSVNDGNDRLLGGDGWDTLDYSSLNGVVQVDQLAGTTSGTANNDTLLDVFEQVVGTRFADVLSGGNGVNSINGGGGNDQIFANGGDDWVRGGTGNDTITLGPGNDRFQFDSGDGSDTITDFVAGPGIVDVINLKFESAVRNFSEVMTHASQVGLDTVLDFTGGDVITLLNVSVSLLHSDDFAFV
jgi:serralysin